MDRDTEKAFGKIEEILLALIVVSDTGAKTYGMLQTHLRDLHDILQLAQVER